MATRTLIKTDTAGWFEDPAQPEKKVRKTNGDQVLTREEFDALHLATQAPSEGTRWDDIREKAKAEVAADSKVPGPVVTLSSGKTTTGATATIQCAWVDPDQRMPAQQKLFDGPIRELTHAAVKKAARGKESAMPCGEERTIKKQDLFQTRFCIAHQKTHRAKIRLRKNADRRARVKAAKAAQA